MAYWRNSIKEAAMSPRYRVTLSEQERIELEKLTKRGKTHARRFIHARALLLSDAGANGPSWSVADTAEALGVSSRTIEHLKKRFVEEGLEAALECEIRSRLDTDSDLNWTPIPEKVGQSIRF
jgi:hypothetical protein